MFIRLGELAGLSDGSKQTAAAFSRMSGNFGVGNYVAALENAIEVFENLDKKAQDDFLESLRTLGRGSGIDGLEDLLKDFADFLGNRRHEEDKTTLKYELSSYNYFLILDLLYYSVKLRKIHMFYFDF